MDSNSPEIASGVDAARSESDSTDGSGSVRDSPDYTAGVCPGDFIEKIP